MQISTGITTLDKMLNGGFPNDRTHLLLGESGTGKSTVSMQYLQEGLENGETCFYITTEQKKEELRDTFQNYDFDLDHENLTIITVHMENAVTLDSAGKVPTLKTLTGEDTLDKGTNVPFNVEYITQYIKKSGDPDRIVFDSVSGLTPAAQSSGAYRNSILELISSFNEEMSATALITAEARMDGSLNDIVQSLPFNVHGVLRLWRKQINGEDHHFIRIEKMRGINHDKQQYEMAFNHTGVRIIPKNRAAPASLVTDTIVPSQIEGLDNLLGGGFIPGKLNLMLHDGRAAFAPLLHKILLGLQEQEYHGLYGPHSSMDYRSLEQAFKYQGVSLPGMLDNNEVTIFDMARQEDRWVQHENIVQPQDDIAETYKSTMETIDEPVINVSHFDPLITQNNPEKAKNAWKQLRRVDGESENLFLYALNQNTAPDWLIEYFVDQSMNTIETAVDQTGIQYISVKKSLGGMNGYKRVVEHHNEPPYVQISR